MAGESTRVHHANHTHRIGWGVHAPTADRPVRVAFYRSLFDTEAHVLDLSWDDLAESLTSLRPVMGDNEARKHSCPLWSPVELLTERRGNANVANVTALVLDFDEGAEVGEALNEWDGYAAAAHTTWNNEAMSPRCRVVLPLARPVNADVWGLLYGDILSGLGLTADRQVKDPSRAYYLYARGADGPHQDERRSGRHLDLSDRVAPLLARVERERQARAADVTRRIAEVGRDFTDRGDALAAVRALWAVDPHKRRIVAQLVGADIIDSIRQPAARRGLCPKCGDRAVWWPIQPERTTKAMCNHRKSCGWTGHLYDYLKTNGAKHGAN